MQKYHSDFPILTRTVYGQPLVYFDNAATTQKPRSVVEAISEQYYTTNANVHRGVHYLSQQATDRHELAREAVRTHLNANSTAEIVFTRGTTESINLLAHSLGLSFLKEGDEILLSQMEHHSNIVPWQFLQEQRGVRIKAIPIHADGTLDLEAFSTLLNERTRIVSICHVSNVLGTINPIHEITRLAHAAGALVVIDAAQSVPHLSIDVQEIDCDFLVFSSHKVYGPTGIGVLYGKEHLLEKMPPYQGGGEMIARVSFTHSTYERLPYKFEAGTPDYVGAYALSKALAYIRSIGLDKIAAHENELTQYALQQLQTIDGLRLYGTAPQKSAVVAFNIDHIHPMDLGTLLDRLGFAIRTGHHCAQPLMEYYKVESMARISFALYNTKTEIDTFLKALHRVVNMF